MKGSRGARKRIEGERKGRVCGREGGKGIGVKGRGCMDGEGGKREEENKIGGGKKVRNGMREQR